VSKKTWTPKIIRHNLAKTAWPIITIFGNGGSSFNWLLTAAEKIETPCGFHSNGSAPLKRRPNVNRACWTDGDLAASVNTWLHLAGLKDAGTGRALNALIKRSGLRAAAQIQHGMWLLSAKALAGLGTDLCGQGHRPVEKKTTPGLCWGWRTCVWHV